MNRDGNGPGFCIPGPDPRAKTRNPDPARILIGFFFQGPDPPRWAPRAPFNLLGPNLAQLKFFFLKPIELFFARLKPMHWVANLSPFKALLGSQFKPIHWAANSSPFIGKPINHNYKSINHQTPIHL